MTEYDEPLLPTRRTLLSRLRQWNDDASWQEFFDSYWKLIYGVCRRSDLDDRQAQEVVQDTFVTLARKLPEFQYDRSKGAFKTWLYRVTRSRIQDFVKKRGRWETRLAEKTSESKAN